MFEKNREKREIETCMDLKSILTKDYSKWFSIFGVLVIFRSIRFFWGFAVIGNGSTYRLCDESLRIIKLMFKIYFSKNLTKKSLRLFWGFVGITDGSTYRRCDASLRIIELMFKIYFSKNFNKKSLRLFLGFVGITDGSTYRRCDASLRICIMAWKCTSKWREIVPC